jgi:hypothetical protein
VKFRPFFLSFYVAVASHQVVSAKLIHDSKKCVKL